MRKDIFLFAAGTVLTALAVKYATATLLWDAVFWGGITAMVFSTADAALRKFAVSLAWQIFTYGLLVGVLAGIILYVSPPRDESLPGFGSYAYLRLYDTPELRRRVIYDFANADGGEIKFFLSASDQFNFSVTDIHKETYSLDIPLTDIPIDPFIFLFCQVGLKENETILQVFVDDKEVGSRTLPFKIELGDVKKVAKGTMGADVTGQNNAPFKIAEMALSHSTLTGKQRTALMDNFRDYLKNIKSPLTP